MNGSATPSNEDLYEHETAEELALRQSVEAILKRRHTPEDGTRRSELRQRIAALNREHETAVGVLANEERQAIY